MQIFKKCFTRYLSVFWRWGNRQKPVEKFEMVIMTFGATFFPYIAQKVKNTNAMDYSEQHPRAIKSILHRRYVDDNVDCLNTEDEAIQVSTAVRNVRNIEHRNFVSNSSKILEGREALKDQVGNFNRTLTLQLRKCSGYMVYFRCHL